MRNHAANGPVKDFGRSTMMEGARLFRVDDMSLVQEVEVAQLKERCISTWGRKRPRN